MSPITLFILFTVCILCSVVLDNPWVKIIGCPLGLVFAVLFAVHFHKELPILKPITPVDITVYQPTEMQTDSSPLITADGSRIDPDSTQKWVAISRDLLAIYPLNAQNPPVLTIRCKCPYDGETRQVRDVMHSRYTTTIDLLIPVTAEIGKWQGVIIKN